MSAVLVNGEAALWGELTMPRIGVWHGDFAFARSSESTALAGAVTIELGSTVWRGTVRRSGENRGVITVRVVGGADGLASELPAKAYQGVPVRLVVDEILQECGETLAATSDATVLGAVLGQWSRSQGPAGMALASLLDIAGAPVWRVLAGGTVWIGTDAWATSALTEYVYLAHSPGSGFIDFAAADPAVFPGEVFRDRRVSVVTHRFSDRKLRTRVWFEDESGVGEFDRMKAGLSAFVRAQFPRLDHFAGYWSRVVAQNADGTLEIVPDDQRIPTRSNVPIRYGVPGVSAKVAAGARVLLEFAGGDPSKPFATVWEAATPTEIVIGPGANQPAALATALRTELDALWTAIQTHVHPVTVDPSTHAGTAAAATVTKTAQTIASSIVKVST